MLSNWGTSLKALLPIDNKLSVATKEPVSDSHFLKALSPIYLIELGMLISPTKVTPQSPWKAPAPIP